MHGNRLVVTLTAGLAYLAKVQADHHIILGAPVPSDDYVPARLNINDLQKAGGPSWDLYIQALRAMQDMPDGDELSYFQTAGIHGMPYIEWDNAGPQEGNSNWLGYCPHGVSISWVVGLRNITANEMHRRHSSCRGTDPTFCSSRYKGTTRDMCAGPVLTGKQEQLVRHATKIAQTYPQSHRDEYVKAAANLRAPYWDWAADSAVPPSSVPSTMTITVANGDNVKQASIANPLQTFNMPAAALNGQYGTFDPYGRPQTIRCPGPYYSYPNSANANIRSRNLKGNLVSRKIRRLRERATEFMTANMRCETVRCLCLRPDF